MVVWLGLADELGPTVELIRCECVSGRQAVSE